MTRESFERALQIDEEIHQIENIQALIVAILDRALETSQEFNPIVSIIKDAKQRVEDGFKTYIDTYKKEIETLK